MSISVLPRRAEAALNLESFEAFKASRSSVSGYRSDDTFRRGKRDVYPFMFYSEIASCTGFTLDYEILEVTKGNLTKSNPKFEVYVHLTTENSWKSVDGFYLDDLEATVTVKFEYPMSIDGVAVVCLKEGINFDDEITVRNATYRSSTIPTTGAVRGCWWDEPLKRSNRYTIPFEFYSTVSRCKGFTLNYEITEVTKGDLEGTFKFAVYVRNSSGDWKYVHEFKMDDLSTSTKVRFDPMSIDAVAVYCMKNATLNYSYNFTITDTITK